MRTFKIVKAFMSNNKKRNPQQLKLKSNPQVFFATFNLWGFPELSFAESFVGKILAKLLSSNCLLSSLRISEGNYWEPLAIDTVGTQSIGRVSKVDLKNKTFRPEKTIAIKLVRAFTFPYSPMSGANFERNARSPFRFEFSCFSEIL